MQAAAVSYRFRRRGVDAATIEKKLKSKIFCVKKVNQAMLDNIAKVNLARFFKDNTLVNQDYIKQQIERC
jgi:elongation factor Ts